MNELKHQSCFFQIINRSNLFKQFPPASAGG